MENVQIDFIYDPSINAIEINGEKLPINGLNEFVYNNVTYVLYNYTTTLVKHTKNALSIIDTKYFDIPLIIEKKRGELSVHDIANITQYQLKLSDTSGNVLGSKEHLSQTLSRLKDDTVKSFTDNNNFNIDPNLKQIVDLLLNQINNCDPQSMIKSLPQVTKINKIYDHETISTSTLLGDLVKYIAYHNTYHDSIVNNRGLTIFPDIVFMLAQISLLMHSAPVKIKNTVNLCSISDLLVHGIIEMAYNILVMRICYELFIMERNEHAKSIKHKLYVQFPILAKQKTIEELSPLMYDPTFRSACEKTGIEMIPFILLYNQSDKMRIKTIYSECKNNKMIEEHCKIKWISPDLFIELIQNYNNSLSEDYNRHNTDLFVKLIAHFVADGNIEKLATSLQQPHNQTLSTKDRGEPMEL
ncbi:P51 [Callinectes sapidus nudivirus]|nr:P51 [Callinectes sapidus nudivirus]